MNMKKLPIICIAFPSATVLASSWNRDLAEETGKAIGNEVREYASESSRLLRDILRDE